jgi:ribonuclease P protein component
VGATQVEPQQKTGPFLRSNRLLDSKDYVRVLRRGRRRSSRDLVVITTKNEEPFSKNSQLPELLRSGSRLGITASRKLGNAVVRNRFKRRVRSWFRHRRGEFHEDVDLVVIARPSASLLTLDELDVRLSRLLDLPAAPDRIR